MVIYGKINKGERNIMEKQLKVIIADDSSLLGENCAKTFKAYGMQVSLCQKDGLKVIERVKNETPDIVLADVFMPNMDILGVIKNINESNIKDKPMVMAMSGFDNERLEKDRNEYALSTDADERMELTTKILQQEAAIPLVQEQLDKAKAQLHRIEMEFLFSGVVIDPDKLLAQADREVVGEATSYTFEKKEYGPAFKLEFGVPASADLSTDKE